MRDEESPCFSRAEMLWKNHDDTLQDYCLLPSKISVYSVLFKLPSLCEWKFLLSMSMEMRLAENTFPVFHACLEFGGKISIASSHLFAAQIRTSEDHKAWFKYLKVQVWFLVSGIHEFIHSSILQTHHAIFYTTSEIMPHGSTDTHACNPTKNFSHKERNPQKYISYLNRGKLCTLSALLPPFLKGELLSSFTAGHGEAFIGCP